MVDEVKTTEKTIRDILYVFFKHKWKIISIFIIVSGVTLFIVITKPDMYTSGAKIVVIGTAITRPHLIVKNIITGSY